MDKPRTRGARGWGGLGHRRSMHRCCPCASAWTEEPGVSPCAVAHRRVLDAHQRGMRSTYLTAAAFCKPPSSGVPDRAVTLLHGLCPTHRPQAVTEIVRNAYLPRAHSSTSPPATAPRWHAVSARSSTTPSNAPTLSFGPDGPGALDDSADLAKLVVEDLTGLVVGDIDAVTCGFGGGDKDHRLRFTRQRTDPLHGVGGLACAEIFEPGFRTIPQPT